MSPEQTYMQGWAAGAKWASRGLQVAPQQMVAAMEGVIRDKLIEQTTGDNPEIDPRHLAACAYEILRHLGAVP